MISFDYIALFLEGMYAMLTLINGVHFFIRAKNCSDQNLLITFRLAYSIMFIVFFQNLLGRPELKFDMGMFSTETMLYVGNLLFLLNMLLVPVCGLLMLNLTHYREIHATRVACHIFPFCVLLLFYAFGHDEAIYSLCYWTFMVYCISIYLLSLYAIMRYQKVLREVYSEPGDRSLSWLYIFLNLLIIQFLLYAILGETSVNLYVNISFYFLFSIGNWWLLCGMLRKQTFDVTEMEEKLKTAKIDIISELSMFNMHHDADEPQSQIDRTVVRLCTEEEIYLDPELTCSTMAAAVGTNRTYMSMWFRNHGTNFNEYINSYRLKRAEHLLLTTNESVLAIGSKSGFNHPNTFRTVFKEQYGCTPKDFTKTARNIRINGGGKR